jgi:hypothetical protein
LQMRSESLVVAGAPSLTVFLQVRQLAFVITPSHFVCRLNTTKCASAGCVIEEKKKKCV